MKRKIFSFFRPLATSVMMIVLYFRVIVLSLCFSFLKKRGMIGDIDL